MGGVNTLKYKVIRGHFYPLVLNFQQVLPQLAAKSFGEELISNQDFNSATSNQPSFERATALLNCILARIEFDQNWCDVLLSILNEFAELKDIKNEVEIALNKEEESSGTLARGVTRTKCKRKPSLPIGHGRRHSDSDLLSNQDSGLAEIFEDQIEEEDISAFDDQHAERTDSSTEVRSELVSSGRSRSIVTMPNLSHALPTSHTGTSSSQAMPGYDTIPYPSTESDTVEQDRPTQKPIERVSSNPEVSHHFISLGDSNTLALNTEIKYLKSQNQRQASELSDQNQRIIVLKKELAESTEKLKQQGLKVNEKDDLINELEKERDEKDKFISTLKREGAETEKLIEALKARCEEAAKKEAEKEAENKEKIKNIHESYKEQLEQLQKKLEDVESKEKEAQINLANARTQLSKAELEKEREIFKLKEEYHNQEKIKLELQLRLNSVQSDKDKELAVKDKELAVKEKELAVKEKELAQEKEKNAHEVARRVQEEKIELLKRNVGNLMTTVGGQKNTKRCQTRKLKR